MTTTRTDNVAQGPRRPVVHIGLPKTATKTLQWRLFAQHSEVFYLGRYDGPQYRKQYRQFGACRDATVFEVMDEIAYRGFRNADTQHCRERLADYLRAHNPQGRVPVWSWESYTTDHPEHRRLRARNIAAVFGPAKIVVSIRHPVGLLESAFMQQLKRDNVGARYRRGSALFFQSIDTWVRANRHREVEYHLDYAQTVRDYVDIFGVDNVCVLVFEELREHGEAFFRRLCDFMEIGADEALELVSDNVDNSRWTEEQISRLEALARSPWRSLRFRYATRDQRREMLDLDAAGEPRSGGTPARVRIGDALRKDIVARTRAGNEWLQETFALNLTDYGYL